MRCVRDRRSAPRSWCQVRQDLAWAEWQAAGQAARVLGLQRTAELAAESRDSSQSLLDRMLRAVGRRDLSPERLRAARLMALQAVDRLRGYAWDLAAAGVTTDPEPCTPRN